MLGLVFLYYLGKKFYELAFDYKKKQWPFAILGIVTYYGCLLLFAFILGIVMTSIDYKPFLELNESVIGLFCIPAGLLGAWLLYRGLEKKWKNETRSLKQADDLIDSIL